MNFSFFISNDKYAPDNEKKMFIIGTTDITAKISNNLKLYLLFSKFIFFLFRSILNKNNINTIRLNPIDNEYK